MKLFKWKTNFKPKFPAIVEKLFGKKITMGTAGDESVAVVPSVNVSEEDKAFEVSVALPGFDKNDVEVEIRDGILCIRSEKQYSDEDRSKNFIRQEFGYASFQRMFELPPDADPDKVQATMKNGVLDIRIARKKSARPKGKVIRVD
ncbi:MAG: Hsp20/alpha crystallin family protein [Bacteroidetes bacterium]|nr:MAG: Hsp20/alpha crystallin family protein [Bacteroidota bacterium]